MDISPISALRPVSMMKRSPEDPDLSRVVEVEHMGRSEDDEYTPADRRASRGLEDDEKAGEASADLDGASEAGAPVKAVNLFA